MTSKILLNTRTAEVGNNYDAQWNIHYPRLNNMESYVLSLKALQVPNLVYPINRFNNKFTFFETGEAQSITCTLPIQGYTGSELATEVALQMTTDSLAGWTYGGSFDTQTKKITITESLSNTFIFMATTSNSAYEELGFDLTVGTLTVAANSHEGTSPINVSGSSYIDVITSFGTLNYTHGPAQARVFARIPLTVPFGSVLFYDSTFHDPLEISSYEIRDIRITLRDDKGNPWELPANAFMALEFGVTIE